MEREESVKAEAALPLFDIKQAKGRVCYRLFSSTVFFGIFLIWFYRLTNIPGAGQQGRLSWIGMFISELVFSFYWIVTQPVRWNVSFYLPFKDRLLHRFNFFYSTFSEYIYMYINFVQLLFICTNSNTHILFGWDGKFKPGIFYRIKNSLAVL